MPAPRFAALEGRVTAAAMQHLANAGVSIAAGPVVNGIFDAAYQTDLDIAGASPAVTLPTAVCAAVEEGITTVVVNATTYIATRHEPDGTGVSVLRLRVA